MLILCPDYLHGLPFEDPNDHLKTFSRVCNTFKIHGLTQDDIKLRLFPFTLQDQSQAWLNSLPNNSINSWNGLRQAFLSKYFPPSKAAHYRQAIMTFQQHGNETLYESWDRFKELIRKCPQHGLEEQLQLGIFYNGLLPDTRASLDAASGGTFMMKTVDEAKQLLDNMTSNHYKWQTDSRSLPKKAGVYEVDSTILLQAQVAALTKQIAEMNKPKLDTCEFCSGNHKAENCNAIMESVQFMRNQGNFGNFNNFGNQWKGSSSNSWNPPSQGGYQRPQAPPGFQNQSQQSSFQNQNPQQNNFQQPSHQQQWSIGRDDWNDLQTTLRAINANLRTLDNRVSQIERSQNERTPGNLPSDTVPNPKGKEHEQVNMIQQKNGRIMPE